MPALAAAVIHKGMIREQAAVGYRKQGSPVKVTENDAFHLASCTKAMTATLIGQSIEQRKLSYGSTAASVFPEFEKSIDKTLRAATVEMLLSHRAGLSTDAEALIHSEKILSLSSPGKQRYEFARLVLSTEPSSTPSKKYAYSNSGYILLGAILEKVTGEQWEDLIRNNLFRPLGMSSAGFGAMGNGLKYLSEPFQHNLIAGHLEPVAPGKNSDNPVFFAPAGGVHCSIGDWAKFVLLHLGHPSKAEIISPETIARLHKAPFGGDYQAGWSIHRRDWAKGLVLSHTGSNNLSYAEVWMVPSRDFAVLAATNCGGMAALDACDELCQAVVKRYL